MSAQPSDPRTRRSRSALETALRELIAERDLSRISISDITKRADVNRSTFYEHYTDMHDLAAAACTAMFDELIASTPMFDLDLSLDGGTADNPLTPLFTHVAEQAHLYRPLLGVDGSARVINHLLQRVTVASHVNRRLAGTTPATHADNPADIPHDPESAFIAGAALGTVIDWLRRGCPGTPEQMATAVWPCLIGAVSVSGIRLPPTS